jgi:peptidoglycan/LPS O-acetylase OafA/YrhL
MALFDASGLIFVAWLLFCLWAVYDVVTTEPNQVRNLPKVMWLVVVVVLAPLLALGPILWLFLGRPARTSGAARHSQGQRRPRRAPAPEPETERDASQRVVTDRRSAELDRLLEEWERGRRDEAAPES